jgi:hypothetical protein
MSYPWGETTRGPDGSNWGIPKIPGVPAQTDPLGWQWENGGVAGPIPLGPPYTMVETTDTLDYFSAPYYPASATQYRGQDRMP